MYTRLGRGLVFDDETQQRMRIRRNFGKRKQVRSSGQFQGSRGPSKADREEERDCKELTRRATSVTSQAMRPRVVHPESYTLASRGWYMLIVGIVYQLVQDNTH